MKTQKVVNFPYKDFDPTAYLASVPQETILRHRQLIEQNQTVEYPNATDSQQEVEMKKHSIHHMSKLVDIDEIDNSSFAAIKKEERPLTEQKIQRRQRLESTSLIKTPIIDGDLRDFHEHKLLKGQDPFDLKYQLYAVVVSRF